MVTLEPRFRRLVFWGCALASLLGACGGSAELNASSISGSSGNPAGVSGGTSTPAQGIGGMSAAGDSGQAGAASSTGGRSNSGGAAPINAGGAGGTGGSAGTAGTLGAAGGGGANGTPRSCDHVTFDDPALEAVIRKWLSKPTGELTRADAQSISLLQASNAGITSLGGVECLRLSAAFLDGNEIADLKPLAAQKSLESLVLRNDPVADLSPLTELAELRSLDLSGLARPLTPDDFTALASLPNLISLTLEFDVVTSLAPLGKAPALATLSLASSQLIGTETLSELTQITTLELSNTQVPPNRIAPLTQLTYLGYQLNDVRDISPLALLTNLQLLDVSFNNIDDLTPLASMPQLQRVALSGNRITDLAPLRALTNLSTVNAQDNRITTLTPLVQNMAIGSGDLLWLGENPLDCAAEAANIAALQARQVGVQSDCTAVPQP